MLQNRKKYYKTTIPLKLVYRFSVIPIKMPAGPLIGIDKLILKFIQKHNVLEIVQYPKRRKNWEAYISWFQNTVQSYSNQNNVVLR